jgi:3-oxoacyl-[acyl-carrier protein] reductase
MELEGKVALVLGAIRGIGKEIGLSLAKHGVKVALNYFDWEEELEGLKQDFAATGNPHLILKTNLLEVEKTAGLIQQVVDYFGRLDILINNIERGGWPVIHGPYKPDQWDLEMETTLRAKRWVFDSALPHLKESGDGAVINFSSIAAIVGRSGPAGMVFNDGYAAANRGIASLTETWARMGAPRVRVNDHTLLQRTGTVDDVAKTVLFILKDAPFMTGAVLRLDGGYVLGGEKVPDMPPGVV